MSQHNCDSSIQQKKAISCDQCFITYRLKKMLVSVSLQIILFSLNLNNFGHSFSFDNHTFAPGIVLHSILLSLLQIECL